MSEIQSERARKILLAPVFFKKEKTTGMRKYPGDPQVWIEIEWGEGTVKNLSFFGELSDVELILLESMGTLLVGKPIEFLHTLTVRECEAFLRDRNSVMAISPLTKKIEKELKSIFTWLSHWPRPVKGNIYRFPSEMGAFRTLSLVEKIRQVKAFLLSPEILTLYGKFPRPELVDVEDLTVYIEAPYSSQEEKSLFEELHLLGVEAFQEENLNFIPEA